MNEKLVQAMDHISDSHIAQAARAGRVKKRYFLAAVAALLAMAMFVNVPNIPLIINAKAVSVASESRQTERPDSDDYEDREEYLADARAWSEALDSRNETVMSTVESMNGFFAYAADQILSGSGGGNAVWSPVNAYICLAMLAEVTDTSTRQELLDLLGAENTAGLQTSVGAIWESVYKDNGDEICVLANSLWLDDSISYVQETMDTLAYDYYASVYQGELGSSKTNRAMSNWLTNQTGGFMKDRTQGVQMDPDREWAIALASTIYFQSKWVTEFNASDNTNGVFHSPGGDVNCTYMNQSLRQMYYYWGDSFGAVKLGLKNGSGMWIILPDEDKTVDDVLVEREYMSTVTSYAEAENSKYMKVNLTVPKFDVEGSVDLKENLQDLGLTEVFEPYADFSASVTSKSEVWVDSIQQSTRVSIDEEGVTAASYIVIKGAGAAEPPEEIIDFVVDRPFIFVITSAYGVPLFMGVVNEP